MKKKICYILCGVVCFIAIGISIMNLRISNVVQTVSDSEQNNIVAFVNKIEGMLLSTYEIDITGKYLNDEQKKYITDMYILLNREKFVDFIKQDNSINLSKYNEAYSYLFGTNYTESDSDYVSLNELNISKFYIDSSKILSYRYENEMHIIEIQYTQVFDGKEYKYLVEYNVGYKNGKYYLIGFEIK